MLETEILEDRLVAVVGADVPVGKEDIGLIAVTGMDQPFSTGAGSADAVQLDPFTAVVLDVIRQQQPAGGAFDFGLKKVQERIFREFKLSRPACVK